MQKLGNGGPLWDISGGSFSQNWINPSNDPRNTGLQFLDNGSQLYLLSRTTRELNKYNLSTPYDLSTASLANTYVFSSAYNQLMGLYIKPDGTKFYVIQDGGDFFLEFNMSTPFTPSTATLVYTYAAGALNNPAGFYFKDDGTMFFCTAYNEVRKYEMSTPWDLSTTGTPTITNLGPNTAPQTRGCWFDPTGLRFWVMQSFYPRVVQYDLSTPWDVSTFQYNGVLVSFVGDAPTANRHGLMVDGNGGIIIVGTYRTVTDISVLNF